MICGRTASPLWVGKLSHCTFVQRPSRGMTEIYITHGAQIQLRHGCTHMGHWGGSGSCHCVGAHRLCRSTLQHSTTGMKFSPFSQPSLPAPYFSGSKQDGLQWRVPCNPPLTISIWQLLWIPAAGWKGQKPWLCWGVGAPGETYVNKAQLCSLLHLSLFSHSCLDLRWN